MADANVQGLVTQAEQLLALDPKLVTDMRAYAKDSSILQVQRQAIAETIEKLQSVIGHGT